MSFALNVVTLPLNSGQGAWNGRKANGNGVANAYEELSGGDYNPPVPPHASSDDSSLYSKPPNGGKS